MLNSANLKARRPTSVELRARVVAAIDEFIAGSNRREWVAAFSSDQFHLVIDDEHEVSIAEMAAPTAALYLFSIPLGSFPSILGRSSSAGASRPLPSTLRHSRLFRPSSAQSGGWPDSQVRH